MKTEHAIMGFVRWYQRYYPRMFRGNCPYTPTCSEYMYLAVQKHGSRRGFWMGIKRLLRCRKPYGGIDYP